MDTRVEPDDLPDGLVVVDRTRTVVAWNRAAVRLTRIAAGTAIGRPLGEALPLRDGRDRDWWSCVRPFDGLSTRTGHPEVELRLSGGTDLLVTARYVRSAGPRTPVTSVLVSLRGTAARARHELDRADLVATVAHELRSPLTSSPPSPTSSAPR